MTICDSVSVTIAHPEKGMVSIEMPAFTVSPIELGGRIADLMVEYLRNSMRTEQPVSLADFTLFLIGKSAQDPREQ